jgi:hypothetical protein
MDNKETLQEIATLEAERTRLLGKELLNETERKRLVELRQVLSLLWEKRRKELNTLNPPRYP